MFRATFVIDDSYPRTCKINIHDEVFSSFLEMKPTGRVSFWNGRLGWLGGPGGLIGVLWAGIVFFFALLLVPLFAGVVLLELITSLTSKQVMDNHT